MKESYWGYVLIFLGVFSLVIMMIIRDYQTTNDNDYYLMKEVLQDAMIDAVDYSYWREYGHIRIIKEKFAENYLRRFAHSMRSNKTYKIELFDISEDPPKASVKITTATGNYKVVDSESFVDFGVVSMMSGILDAKTITDDKKVYTITTNVVGGTTKTKTASVLYGDNYSINVKGNSGYIFNSYNCTGSAVKSFENGTIRLQDIRSDITCSVSYEPRTHKVDVTVVMNGVETKLPTTVVYHQQQAKIQNVTSVVNSLYQNDAKCTGTHGVVKVMNRDLSVEYVESDISCRLSFISGCAYYEDNAVAFEKGYSESIEQFNARCDGFYKLEVWGAQGLTINTFNNNTLGGKGGYSSGVINLNSGSTLYVGVGGQGKEFNGGGASHIAMSNGQLKTLASDTNSILLVAGGGGACSTFARSDLVDDKGNFFSGGYGGGANSPGGNGVGLYAQTNIGTINVTGGIGGPSPSEGAGVTGVEFGQGKSVTSGGGYYGGGAGENASFIPIVAGGGGGSGFANTSRLTYISGKDGVREGDGYVKITYLGDDEAKINENIDSIIIPEKQLLYSYGNKYESLTGGWGLYKEQYNGTISDNGDNIEISYSYMMYSYSYAETIKPINLNKYSKVCIKYSLDKYQGYGNEEYIQVHLGLMSGGNIIKKILFDLPKSYNTDVTSCGDVSDINTETNVRIATYDVGIKLKEVYIE